MQDIRNCTKNMKFSGKKMCVTKLNSFSFKIFFKQRSPEYLRLNYDFLLKMLTVAYQLSSFYVKMPTPEHRNPCLGGHDIYNMNRTFIGYHNDILSLSDLWLAVEKKIFK